VEQLVARRAHILKILGFSPSPATKKAPPSSHSSNATERGSP